MKLNTPITPCLWFDSHAEDAAQFYVSIFPDSKVGTTTRYGKAGFEIHRRPEGSAMTVAFEINRQPFLALNGGPMFRFTEAVSFQVLCDTQEQIDYYWEKLTAGGDERAQQCGWLKDKFGVSWQVAPLELHALLSGPDPEASGRATEAMLKMKKFDIAAIKRAAGR